MSEHMIKRKGGWLSTSVGDDMVMMSTDTGNYVTVSGVGARIWELIAKPQSMDALCARLEREFEVAPEACRADVGKFLDEMTAQGAIEIEESPGV
ncbi:MAG: PqqD family protein [Pseudolabrys sp.]